MKKHPQKTGKRYALFLWLSLLVVLNATAQKSEKKDWVIINERNKKDFSVESASFTKEAPYRKGMGMEILETYIKPKNSHHDLKLLNSTTTKKQTTVERYQQYLKGIKVEQGQYTIMYDKENKATFMNGNYYTAMDEPDMLSKISTEKARDLAIASLKAEIYAWQEPGMERHLKNERKDSSATYYPQGELVFVEDKSLGESDRKLHLAYKFDVYALKPLSREAIYIDASDGKVLHRNAILHDILTTGNSLYSGSVSFEVTPDASGSPFYFQDITRLAPINTWWGSGFAYSSPALPPATDAAIDAHWGAEQVYDYWQNVHGRNSYDNVGGPINSYVHYGTSWDNAAWTGYEMIYGDGSYFSPLVSIDVCAHELGHAICQYTSNLQYQSESGAMNEGFSDIWGAVIEHYVDPHESDVVAKDMWTLGEEISPAAVGMRSMSDPKSHGHPDTYGGINWYPVVGCIPSGGNDWCGVHTNSGVLNHWFFLLSSGGSGVNDIGNVFFVSGIGITSAAEIAYGTELLLTNTSNFLNCRVASINAATALFGPCSPEVDAVANAWYAVGIGPNPRISGSSPICQGSTTTLTGPGVGGTWSSSNTSVATINPATGLVTGLAGGAATITYSFPAGCFTTYVLVVLGNPSIAGASPLCLGSGVAFTSASAGGYWSSSNTGVASVGSASGFVNAISSGAVTITYTLPSGCFTTYTTGVFASPFSAITGTTLTCVGQTATLSCSPGSGNWSSSNSAIATVDASTGVINGISGGTAHITYALSSGCYTVSPFPVTPIPSPISGTAHVCFGLTGSLSCSPAGGVWTSSNATVAAVDASGVATGTGVGTSLITYGFSSGCQSTVSFSVNPVPGLIMGMTTVCGGANLSLSNAVPGGVWTCTTGTGTAMITPLTGVLTGGSAGTVTVKYEIPGGCYTTAVINVLTGPGGIGGASAVCEGATTTLSNGVAGGTWVSSSPPNATIAASGIVTGIAAGSLTITYTLSSGCSVTMPFAVNATPHFPASSPSIVCVGSSVTLSPMPTGGAWSWFTTPGALSVSGGVVSGLAVGTGTVTYSLVYPGTPTSVCLTTQPFTVLPALSITGSYNSVCAGSGVTLSATSSGGTWSTSNPSVATISPVSPFDGLLVGAPGGSYPSGTPVTVIYSIGAGCIATYNASVYWNDDACSPCSAGQFASNPFNTLPSIILTSTIAPGNYYLPGNAVIMNDVTAQDAVVFAEPGALLSVDPAYSLTSNGSHFFSCSGNMWKGIELKSDAIQTARVVLLGSTGTSGDQSTLIEDARTGILLQGAQVPNPGGPYFIDSRNAIFNKNSNGILMENYYPASGSSLPGTPDIYEIHIENTTFTSRKLNVSGYPFSWPWNYTPSGLKYNMSVPTPYESPYKIASYPYVLCNDGTPAYNGIRFKNVGNTTGGTYEGVKIGEPATATPVYGSANVEWNLFDCLGYGISGINTNLISQNNVFQESKTTLVGGIIPIGPFIEQVGIYTSMDNGRPYRLEVSPSISGASWFYTEAPNRFYNCRTGVFSMNYNKIIGLKSEMRSTQLQSVDFDSRSGYLLESSSYEEVKINENSIYNIANGVRFTSGYIPSTFVDLGDGTGYVTLDRQNLGDLEINFNRIQAALGTVAPTTQYLSQGIAVINAMPGGGYSNVTGGLHTDNNRMRDAYRGILVTGYEMQWANTRSNLITVRPDKYPKESYGICHGRNYQGAVITNTVTGTANPNDLYADNVRAYLMKSNTKSAVMCNIAENTNRGFEFQANNPDTRWTHNSMEKHMKGFVLNNAEIGPQQNAWSPCANTWIDPTWWDLTSSRFQTYVFGGPNATSSPLFYHGPAPTENGGDAPGNDYNVPGALVYTSTLPLDECSKEQPWPESGRFAVSGATADSNKTGIQSDRQQQYTLHPNPNDGNFIISQAVTDNEAVSVVVMDMVGKILYKDAVKFIGNDHRLGLPDIASGVYVVNITDSKGRSFVFKFVKD